MDAWESLFQSVHSHQTEFPVGDDLVDIHAYVMNKKGKYLRSILGASMVIDLCIENKVELSDRDLVAMCKVLAAVEMMQTASLIIDDLPDFDDATTRRGDVCPHIKFGEAISIACACDMMTMAYRLVKAAGSDHTVRLGMFYTMCLVTSQVIEPMLDAMHVTVQSVLYVHMLKTASLFVAPLQMCVSALGLSDILDPNTLCNACMIGCVYQMIDDVVDVTWTTREAGKNVNVDAAINRPSIVRCLGLDASIDLIMDSLDVISISAGVLTNRFIIDKFYNIL